MAAAQQRPTQTLRMRLLPAGLPFCQQFPEHAKQLAAGTQLPLAEQDELLRRDLRARLDLGEVRTVVADTGGERLLRQPSREPSTAQVGAELPCAFLHEPMSDGPGAMPQLLVRCVGGCG